MYRRSALIPGESPRLVSTRRIDYYDDPQAPKANSLVPSVNVVVTNEVGDVLLIRRTDNGSWALPGGAVDLGESVAQAAVRETREETGIDCTITGVVRIYSVAGPASGDRGEGDRTCHKSTATRFRREPKLLVPRPQMDEELEARCGEAPGSSQRCVPGARAPTGRFARLRLAARDRVPVPVTGHRHRDGWPA